MNILKQYRIGQKLTQQQLADQLKCSQVYICRWEKAIDAGRGLTPKNALFLETNLGIPKDNLLYPSEQAAA